MSGPQIAAAQQLEKPARTGPQWEARGLTGDRNLSKKITNEEIRKKGGGEREQKEY